MKTSLRLFHLVAAALPIFVFAGCASSSSVVTGSRRPAVPASEVRIYSDAPAHSETIGLVQAHSIIGLGNQGHLDAALNELRTEAGRLGANGVVLTRTDEKPIAFVGDGGKSGFIGVPIETPHIEARAIYVTKN